MTVREETGGDAAGVHRVLEQAFPTPEEAAIVERLQAAGAASVACVAEDDGGIVGQILFSPVTIERAPAGVRAVGLGPMAVVPARQRHGIGSALVEAGLAGCRARSVDLVVVLGHPTYYPRFGFTPAGVAGLRCEYDVPPEVFMALALRPAVLEACEGLVRYHPAFAGS